MSDGTPVFPTNVLTFLFQGQTPTFVALNTAPSAGGVISYTFSSPASREMHLRNLLMHINTISKVPAAMTTGSEVQSRGSSKTPLQAPAFWRWITVRALMLSSVFISCLTWVSFDAQAAPVKETQTGLKQSASPLTLQIEPGEKWWGGAVVSAPSMPFATKPFALDMLGNDLGNQAVPLLISQHGRYVWCDDPFKFQFKDGTLVVTPHFGAIQSG